MDLNNPTLTPSDAALRALVDAVDAYLGARPGVEQRHAWAMLERCQTAAKATLASLGTAGC